MARTGTGVIPAGAVEHFVSYPALTSDSFVGVTLTSDPGDIAGGASVECIHKNPGYGFTVELTNATQNSINFDYIVS